MQGLLVAIRTLWKGEQDLLVSIVKPQENRWQIHHL